MLFQIVLLFGFLVSQCTSHTSSQVKSLRTFLLTTKGYDPSVRPMTDHLVATDVNVEYNLGRINGLDGVTQAFSTTGFLKVNWRDEGLTWSPPSYGGIQYLFFSQSVVWKPALTLKNGFAALSELGSSFINVKVDYQGNVEWKPYEVFDTKCLVDIAYYPFDSQSCVLEFVTWDMDSNDVRLLINGTDGVKLTDYHDSTEWNIFKLSSQYEHEGPITRIIFTVDMKRKPMFILTNLVLPVMSLGLLDVFTFVLPADCGEKMSYSITVFLANAVFLTIASASLPANSVTIPLISIYLLYLISLGMVVLMITAVQIRILQWDNVKSVPKILQKITKSTRRLRCRRRAIVTEDNIDPVHIDKAESRTKMKYIKSNDAAGNENDQSNDAENIKDQSNETGKLNIQSKDTGSYKNDDVLWSEVSAAADIHFFFFFLLTLIFATIAVMVVGTIAENV